MAPFGFLTHNRARCLSNDESRMQRHGVLGAGVLGRFVVFDVPAEDGVPIWPEGSPLTMTRLTAAPSGSGRCIRTRIPDIPLKERRPYRLCPSPLSLNSLERGTTMDSYRPGPFALE